MAQLIQLSQSRYKKCIEHNYLISVVDITSCTVPKMQPVIDCGKGKKHLYYY